MNKSIKSLLAALLCAALLSGCTPNEQGSTPTNSNITSSVSDKSSSSDKESSTKTEESSSSKETSTDSAPESSAPESSSPESSAPVEDANIKIASWKLSTDYSGKDVLVVEYEWTNTEDEAANFMTTFTDKVYQNGVECDSTVIGCDDVDAQKQMNDVKPGVTYNVAVGYLLQDKTNANVVVSELFGDDIINETIDLGGGEGAAAPGGEIAETSIKIADHFLAKDYADADILVVNYEFYNGEDSAKGFSFMFNDKAFQNGVECDSTVISDDVDTQTQLNEIQPGVTYTVSVGYHISDMSDIEIEVTDLFGTKEYLTETISLS